MRRADVLVRRSRSLVADGTRPTPFQRWPRIFEISTIQLLSRDFCIWKSFVDLASVVVLAVSCAAGSEPCYSKTLSGFVLEGFCWPEGRFMYCWFATAKVKPMRWAALPFGPGTLD